MKIEMLQSYSVSVCMDVFVYEYELSEKLFHCDGSIPQRLSTTRQRTVAMSNRLHISILHVSYTLCANQNFQTLGFFFGVCSRKVSTLIANNLCRPKQRYFC